MTLLRCTGCLCLRSKTSLPGTNPSYPHAATVEVTDHRGSHISTFMAPADFGSLAGDYDSCAVLQHSVAIVPPKPHTMPYIRSMYGLLKFESHE